MMNKRFSRFLGIILSLAMVFCMSNVCSIPVHAAGRGDGTNYLNAKKLTVNTKSSETVSGNKNKVFELTLDSAGRLDLAIAGTTNSRVYIFSGTNEKIKTVGIDSQNYQIDSDMDFDLSSSNSYSYCFKNYYQPGKYYIVIKNKNESTLGKYEVKATLTPVAETCPESLTNLNDSFVTARNVNLNSRVIGVKGISDRIDVYKFIVTKSGRVTVDINIWQMVTGSGYFKVVLYDSNYDAIDSWEPKYDSAKGKCTYNGEVARTLTPGVYYISLSDYNNYNLRTCKYDFCLKKSSEPVKVTSITLNKKSATLYMDGTKKVTLTASVLPTTAVNKSVTWKSSNTKVATVTSKGVVTAIGGGTAKITATANDGSEVVSTCTVTVKKAAGVVYKTHVQGIGWQKFVSNGAVSGTSGQSKRLEAIEIKLENAPYSGGIEYSTHVQGIGWQKFVSNGAMAGTSGQSKRLEAIKIRLTGDMKDQYDVYYRVHAQNIGWLGWAKNGQMAGTSGYSYRLEAIQIVLVRKGGAAPAKTYQGVTSVTTAPSKSK